MYPLPEIQFQPRGHGEPRGCGVGRKKQGSVMLKKNK